MKRPTIADVARSAGVSKGAVSYALNGQPGVSEATRKRILKAADTLGFRANIAARALARASTKVIGLALHRPAASTLGTEPFLLELINGVEAELSPLSYAVLMQMVDDHTAEIDLYRRWWCESRVDGVLLWDVRNADARIAALQKLGLPAVVIGPPGGNGTMASIWSDDAASTVEAVEHLAALGHRRIARVGGPPDLAHTTIRMAAFADTCDRLQLAAANVYTDYTGEAGARATRGLLSQGARPTALIYDNDIMAIAGLAVAQQIGLSVPEDLSVVVWDDSPICRLVHPPLTAFSRNIRAYGIQSARLLLAAIAAEPVDQPHVEPAHLTRRGSTARAPTTGG